ncbi:NAD-dependent epimerase/dehydratase family protein [Mariniblastus fucicola]|uniref:UDP-glucose 4-epimerase n=1 Tax=Mariniblastus fucicola TaxID=980251 RepID=A0A5B9PAY0_9BACT|nr:NAD-dependent epimerase/dehydratase family protein [Mariniblastus fucicola]QEG20281.1 UDP-glucose 4-epimerase [Mariniblastus fucicola]
MKYLITGCAGFIGSRVAAKLLGEGHQVHGVDDLNDYYDISLKFHRLEPLLMQVGFSFDQAGIENRDQVDRIFEQHKFDAVINLAAAVGVRYSLENPHVYMTTNGVGNLNLLEAMRHAGVRKYVLASTSSLYAGQQMPFLESLPVNTPISPYAASKKAAESMAWSYHHLFDIDVSVVRYFTVYGPAGRPDMGIFRFVRWIAEGEPIQIFGDGEQSRDFTFVDDIAEGTVRALKPLGFEIINLGGGEKPVSLNAIIQKLASRFGRKPMVEYRDPHEADMQSTWADISKAKQLLDWEPTISIDDGLEQCADWYLYNLPWAREIQLDRPAPKSAPALKVG